MATLEIPSNVKCITSGQVPTTTNLKDGEFAFGKVGGVAKLYGNVNGVIIDFTGDSGDIPANINTFTEVHDVLILTASDTIHTLGAKIVALGQSVIHVRPNDAARAQVDRIMGNPSTGGPPTSYCDYWFKVLSEHLIYVFFGFGGEWGIINYLYNSAKHSQNEWSMCPRWMPIDPSKLEAGVADPLTLANGLNIGTLGSDDEMPSYLKLTTSGIAYMLGSSAVSNALFSGGPIGNIKTLFGNQQSIYGSGNIDLYRHSLYIHFEHKSSSDTRQIQMYVQLISSSNTNIDSLIDLFSMFSNIKDIPVSGTVTDGLGQNGVCVSVTEFSMSGKITAMLVDGGGAQYNISSATLHAIRDNVTTV